MRINEWPLSDRPREKFISRGAEALSDAELLAIVIRVGSRGKTALDVARALLQRYGTLRGVFKASVEELSTNYGVGKSVGVQIQVARVLGERSLKEKLDYGPSLESPRDAERYLMMHLADSEVEIFGCLFLDTHHRLIAYEDLFRGSISSATVHTREVIKRVLDLRANAVIICHNHPSGETEPSRADVSITARLKDALSLIDVRLLDHIIVGNGHCSSLSEKGLI